MQPIRLSKRRLATPRRAGDRQKDPRIESQSNVFEGLDFLFAEQIILVYMFDADNAHSLALPANRVDGQHNGVKTMEIMTFRHTSVKTALALLSVAILTWTHPAAGRRCRRSHPPATMQRPA
jgi:hypothetical protein